MLDFFDKKIFQSGDVVHFILSPVSDVYRYYIFKGTVHKVIEHGESYYYEIPPTEILSKKAHIGKLNRSSWICTKASNKRPYCVTKKVTAPVMTRGGFLKSFEGWNMRVAPVLVYQYKTEVRKAYGECMEYLARKLEEELEFVYGEIGR